MTAKKKNRLVATLRSPAAQQPTPTPVKETLQSAKTSSKSRRTTIYLSDHTWRELKKATVDDGSNVSEVIEELVKKYLADRQTRTQK